MLFYKILWTVDFENKIYKQQFKFNELQVKIILNLYRKKNIILNYYDSIIPLYTNLYTIITNNTTLIIKIM